MDNRDPLSIIGPAAVSLGVESLGDELWGEGDGLWGEGDMLWGEGDRLCACFKLYLGLFHVSPPTKLFEANIFKSNTPTVGHIPSIQVSTKEWKR